MLLKHTRPMMSSRPLGTSPPPSPSPLTVGDLLGGRYRVESKIRTRAAGILFSATDLTSGARVVAHVLVAPDSLRKREEKREEKGAAARVEFLAGAHRARSLTSPHVARLLDAGVIPGGHPWIVREHLGSDTLAAHLLEHGAIQFRDAVAIAIAICDALAEAHSKDVLHLSLGLEAVHVAWSASGLVDVKVTGIGTAAAEQSLALHSPTNAEGVLRAPEQLWHGSTVDHRADVWAIGVLLHTMLAGRAPFSTDTPSGASLSVILDEPPRLTNVPVELAELVKTALSRDPARRPQSTLDFAGKLAPFSASPDCALQRVERRRRNSIPPEKVVPPSANTDDTEETLVQVTPRPRVPHGPTRAPHEQAAPRPSVDPARSPDAHWERDACAPAVLSPTPLVEPAPKAHKPSWHDEPTHIIVKPATSFPRRTTLKALGFATVIASAMLLAIIGAELVTRSSRHSAAIGTVTPALSAVGEHTARHSTPNVLPLDGVDAPQGAELSEAGDARDGADTTERSTPPSFHVAPRLRSFASDEL